MAVTGTITITTLLFFYLVGSTGTPLWLVAVGRGALLGVDLLFLAANLTKMLHGAWLPLRDRDRRLHGAHDLAARAGLVTTLRSRTRARSAPSSTSSTSSTRR